MTKNNFALVIAILALVVAGVAVTRPETSPTLGGTTEYQKKSFLEGFYAGTGRQFELSRTGLLTSSSNLVLTTTNTATSSAKFGCWDSHATSTETAVRLSATTTPGYAFWEYGTCSSL